MGEARTRSSQKIRSGHVARTAQDENYTFRCGHSDGHTCCLRSDTLSLEYAVIADLSDLAKFRLDRALEVVLTEPDAFFRGQERRAQHALRMYPRRRHDCLYSGDHPADRAGVSKLDLVAAIYDSSCRGDRNHGIGVRGRERDRSVWACELLQTPPLRRSVLDCRDSDRARFGSGVAVAGRFALNRGIATTRRARGTRSLGRDQQAHLLQQRSRCRKNVRTLPKETSNTGDRFGSCSTGFHSRSFRFRREGCRLPGDTCHFTGAGLGPASVETRGAYGTNTAVYATSPRRKVSRVSHQAVSYVHHSHRALLRSRRVARLRPLGCDR